LNVLLIGSNGYVGSKVYEMLKQKDIKFTAIDNLIRPSENIVDGMIIESYKNLNLKFINEFTDCIFLGGHSSVQMSIDDQTGAFQNNFIDLIKFREKFKGRFMYASSGSVYSRKIPEICNEESPTMVPYNMYDYTKIAFDNYLQMSKLKGIGLRFGTVNGWSKRIRNDLMINYMYQNALNKKNITALNLKYFRPILFIDDLVEGIHKILKSNLDDGIYNMCSFNSTIEEISFQVSQLMNVKLLKEEGNGTYNFMMDNSKFEESFNFKFTGSVEKIITSLDKKI
tara:strand:- start:66 stop:914 length:849 start_codon:yes stop_codon:yes gene_type:complete